MTSVNLQIWNGPPGVLGSSVVWGDATTNRLSSSVWTGTYRVQDSANLTNTQRPIMANVVTVNTVLPPGTYWLDWQTGGTLGSGPWAPPISSLTLPPSGNGRQSIAGVWGAPSEPAEFPFLIDDTALGGFNCGELLSVVGQWGLTNSRCGDFVSNATAARYESSVQNFAPPQVEGSACGSGPVLSYAPAVHNNVLKHIVKTAQDEKIPFQRMAASRATGTDTDAFAYGAAGVPSALISLPLRYMHTTVETVHRDDVENVIRLIHASVKGLKAGADMRYFQ